MSKKRSPSIMPRFTGSTGKRNLRAVICDQRTVAGNTELAQRLTDVGKLEEYPAGKIIVRQGDTDNDMYMILSGSVSIIVNKREVAVRSTGTHVGEMALLDPTIRRSATIQAKEKTVVLKLPESEVTIIAESYPDYWRRVAVELGIRLRERNKFVYESNSIPNVFIGSSKEALEEASYLNKILTKKTSATCKLWSQGVFNLSQTAIEDLIRATQECDFALLFITPDDTTTSRHRKIASPRDNIVFELGLFMGAIGRNRTYIIVQKGTDLKLPTDLLGLTYATYDSSKQSIGMRLREVTKQISHKISALGPK